MDFKNKIILVTGASGLVGYPTVVKCIEAGANKVIAVDIKISEELSKLSLQHPSQLKLQELFNTVINVSTPYYSFNN